MIYAFVEHAWLVALLLAAGAAFLAFQYRARR
jgi:hypothetical protein